MAVRSESGNVIVKLSEEFTPPTARAQNRSPTNQPYGNGLDDIGEFQELQPPSKFARVSSLAVRNRSRAKSMVGYAAPERRSTSTARGAGQDTRMEMRPQSSCWMNLKERISRYIRKRMYKARHRNVFQSAVYNIMNSGLYKLVLTVVVLLHAVILSLYVPETRHDFQPINMIIYYFTFGFWFFYCVEAVLNIIAYGLILHPKYAYLRQPVFILDLVIILLGLLYLSLRFTQPVFAEVCSTLMALKFIKILSFSQNVQSILDALARSLIPLSYLTILTFLVILFCALLGIELFQGRLHGGCYANYTTPAGNHRSVLVSGFPCDLNEDLGHLVVGSHKCPFNSECREWGTGPRFGIISFDNIFTAILVVFQVITLEGWSAVYFLYESSVGYAFCWVYFVFVTILGNVFILNLLTGVLTNVFKGFNEKSQMEDKKRKKVKVQQLKELNDAQQKQYEGRTTRLKTCWKNTLIYVQNACKAFVVKWDELLSPRFLGKFQQKVCQVVKSKAWLWINIILHSINLILLVSLHFPSSLSFNMGMNITNSLFSVYYIIEVAIRLYGIGPFGFFSHGYIYQTLANFAEATLAVMSIVFLVVYYIVVVLDAEFNPLIILNALWSIKIILACKIFTKSWKHLKEVLDTLGKLLKPILGLTALVFLFLFIYTNMGFRIFGTKLHLRNSIFQPNFNDFGNSFFLVFQLLTTEDWHNTLYSSTGGVIYDKGRAAGYFSSIYFMVGLVVGFFVLVTVFLALAVDELSEVESAENSDKDEDEEKFSSETSSGIQQDRIATMSPVKTDPFQKGGTKGTQAPSAATENESLLSEDPTRPPNISFSKLDSSSSLANTPTYQERYIRRSSLEELQRKLSSTAKDADITEKTSDTNGWKRLQKGTKVFLKEMYEYVGTMIWDPTKELESIPPHSAFFIINHQSRLRRLCFAIVTSQAFQTITFASIFMSSILLTVEIPIGVPVTSQLCSFQRVAIFMDIIFVAFFLIEIFLKMIALGAILHRGSYFRGVFNSMDFLVTLFNLIPIVVFLMNWNMQITRICISYGYDRLALPGSIGALRVIRVLRPLRAMRIKGLYLVVTGLISSIKAMTSIFFFDFLILIIFGVVGVHFFKGSFYTCSDRTIQTEGDCMGQYFEYDYTFGDNVSIPGLTCPVAQPRVWSNTFLNFNNIGIAFVTLFVMLTSEGWQNIMYSGVNSRRPLNSNTAIASMQDSSRPAALYFILYMIFMTFILLQLLVGFVIVTFQQVGIKPYKETKLDRNERSCLQFAITSHAKYKWTPSNKTIRSLRNRLLPLVESTTARVIVGLALGLNVFCLCLNTYRQKELNIAVYYINVGFTMFFALEALVKMTILAPKVYFHNVWNTCEFLIVVGSVLEFILQQTLSNPIIPRSHIVSAARTLILFRLFPEVRRILWTVIRSFKIFPWVAYLMAIVVFIYAVIGMNLFGDIAQETVDASDNTGIHEYNNYANFPAALLLIYRVSTGENWQDVMASSTAGQLCNNCTGLFTFEDITTCGNNFSYFFYVSFYIITVILILNLFVAVIIDHFEYVTMDRSELTDYDLKKFINAWSIYDPEARGLLTVDQVFQMLRNLEPPVGWGVHCPDNVAYRKMMHLCIPIMEVEDSTQDGRTQKLLKINFNATLIAVVRSALKIECGGCPRCQKICNPNFKQKLVKCFPDIKPDSYDSLLASEKDCTVAEVYAALLLQRHWLNLKKRRRQNYELNLINQDDEAPLPNPVRDLSPDTPSNAFALRMQSTMRVPNIQIQESDELEDPFDTSSSAEETNEVPTQSVDVVGAAGEETSGLCTSGIKADRHLSVGIFLNDMQYDDDDAQEDEDQVTDHARNSESQC